MKKLNEYFKLQKEIYEHFGYDEEWTVYPLDDCTKYYWFISNNQIHFFDSKEAYDTEDGMHYYTSELLTYNGVGCVYNSREYTMIKVNTQTDGNKFLTVYDNSKMLPIKEIDY